MIAWARTRGVWIVLALAAGSIFALGVGLLSGSSDLGSREALGALVGSGDATAREIVIDVRLPRVVLAALVGAALAGAGAVFQAVLRNALADPFILGVSGGAALGTTLVIAFGGGSIAAVTVARPAAAFTGAIAGLVLLFALARYRGRTETATLLLTGVILNAFASSLILFLATAGDPTRFQQVMHTLLGQIRSPTWIEVLACGVATTVGLGGVALLAHPLNLLSLGADEAGHLGIEVERVTWLAVIASSLVTAAAVAFAGIVGFVGLIVPHAVRSLLGPDHRVLVPAAVVSGAAFLVLADAGARTVVAPAELPVGVVTALLGGPFFLVLLARRIRES